MKKAENIVKERCLHGPDGLSLLAYQLNLIGSQTTMVHLIESLPKSTGIKRADGFLPEKDERFRLIYETLQIGIFEVTGDGQCLYTNTRWQEIFEMTLAESLLTELPKWFHPEERETIWTEWSEAMGRFSGYSKECRILTKKGNIRWVHLRSTPLFHDSGIRYMGTVEEITQRKEAEEALRKREEAARKMAHEHAIMAEIGQIISSTFNIDEVYARFAEVVRTLLPFDRISISTINPEGQSVTIAYAFGTEIDGRLVGTVLPIQGLFYYEIIQRRSSVLIQTEDEKEIEASHPNFLENFRSGLRSFIGIPLISRDRVVGILIFQSFKSKAYSENEVRLAERIGNQIAGAVANVLLLSERQKAEERLRESEDRYRDLVENSRDFICTHDLGGHLHSVNETGAKLLGYSLGELLQMNVRELLTPRVRDRFEKYIEELKRKGFSQGLMLVQTRGGEERIWEYHSSLRTEGIPNPLVRGMAHDITEQKIVERTLRKTQETLLKQNEELNFLNHEIGVIKEELETIMNCLGDMILLVDNQGRVKRCNRVFKEFTGRKEAEISGATWEDLLRKHQILTNAFFEWGSEVFHAPTGRWFALNAYPYRHNEDGEVLGSVIAIHEITELKRIAETLRVKNHEIEDNRIKLERALNTISTMIHQVLKEKRFRPDPTNPHLKKCYEMLNCGLTNCPCFGKGALKCWEIVGMYCKSKNPWALSHTCNQCHTCEVYRQSISDPVYQISEKFIKMMHLLEEKNKELRKAYRDLKETQAKVFQQEKMASIGQLAAGVAHEINNPMAFISSNLETLEKYMTRLKEFLQIQSEAITTIPSPHWRETIERKKEALKVDFILDDIKDLLKESLEGAERVRKIVQGLKTFARVDEADYKYADINECIESTIHIVWNELKYKATLKKDFGDLPQIKCYPQQLNQVFMNLLVNSAQAIEKQGEIAIKTWVEDETIFIAISDTGCGIPKENLSKIFEPFFTTKEVGKGTGLGLSIVYEIIKKHHGEITVQSEVGKGTTFVIRLPIIRGEGDGRES